MQMHKLRMEARASYRLSKSSTGVLARDPCLLVHISQAWA